MSPARFQPLLCVLLLASVVSGLAAGEAPYGIARRVLWQNTRVLGSPDPPRPYQAVRAFAQLKFNRPLYVVPEPGSDRVLVVEQGGRVLGFPDDDEAAETRVFCETPDHDTYSICFHPRYRENRFVYVFANGPRSGEKKQNRILRYTVRRDGARDCDPDSRRLIIEWPSNGHNGGEMAFGPDGYLYISSGDGTSDSDGDVTGQDISDLASGVLRIDVERPDPGRGYAIPPDNPFVGRPGARGELWAFGFRNPWRMTFDPDSGRLWVGDIGQDLWELIHLVRRGGNYGWSVQEGSHPFHSKRKLGPGPVLRPVVEHPHSEARSITGGVVYNGARFEDLAGAYLYGDYSTGKVWGLRYNDGRVSWQRELADTTLQILGFGQTIAGEILLVDYAGTLHRLAPAPPPERPPEAFPRKLSETGLFVSTFEHRPHPGLIPYSVNAPLWSDGAAKQRWIALPGEGTIRFTERGAWGFPEATVLVKSFSLPVADGAAAAARRIETRLLTLQQGEWVGYSYRWNDEQTDAVLVGAAGAEQTLAVRDADGTVRSQTWRFPSRAECMMCHTRAAGFVLGPSTLQMNKQHDYGGAADNQLRTLEHLGVFRTNPADHVPRLMEQSRRDKLNAGAFLRREVQRQSAAYARLLVKLPEQYDRLVDPYDPRQDLNLRARSYLHANCSICHVKAGGGNSAIDLSFDTPAAGLQAIGVPPLHDRYDLPDARLIAPGAPERSVLHYRASVRGKGQMPPLASSVVDRRGAALIRAWIGGLAESPAGAAAGPAKPDR